MTGVNEDAVKIHEWYITGYAILLSYAWELCIFNFNLIFNECETIPLHIINEV